MIIKRRDKRFYTNYFAIYCVLPFKKEYLPALTLLSNILLNKAKGKKDKQEITSTVETLYGMPYTFSHRICEDKIYVSVEFNVIDESYLNDKTLLKRAIAFIYKMHFEYYEGRFTKKVINEQKEYTINEVMRVNNNPRYIVREGLNRSLDSSWPLSVDLYGTVEEIKNITKEQLIEVHKAIIDAPKSLLMVGPISEAKALKHFKKYFTFEGKIEVRKHYTRESREVIETIKEKAIRQTHIQMGFILDEEFTRHEAIILGNLIGGIGNNRLFKEIREERGLCYSIGGSLSSLNKMLFIYSGIETKNIEYAKKAIIEVINNLKFTKKELKDVVNALCSKIIASDDSIDSLMSDLYSAERIGENIDSKLEVKKYKKISLRRINYLAKKLVYQGIFVLKGVEN